MHKYNTSSKLKETLQKYSKNLRKIKNDKNFFEKDLIKNVYLNGKNQLIALNLINYSMNLKIKLNTYSKIWKILKTKVPLFTINGEFLKQKDERRKSLGNVLKSLEKNGINNNFTISNEKIEEIIKKQITLDVLDFKNFKTSFS